MGTTISMWLGQIEVRTAFAIWVAALSASSIYGQAGVLTWHNDNARTGQNLQETILTPASVNASTFGKLFVIGVDGKVDAQPLYAPSVTIPGNSIHNVLYVMTEHDSAYAFDADTGTQLWHVSLLGPNETASDDRGCFHVTPEIGATATPAIDPQTGPHGTIYVVAVSKDGLGNYHHRLHALDLTTGAEQFGGPVEIQATYSGSGVEGAGGVLAFDPKQHKHRAAMVILNSVVYTSWSSHCDFFPYTSWVIGYNKTTLAQVSVLNLTPNGREGGIWSSGSGPAADDAGNLYLLLGNGTFETTLNAGGFPMNGDFGNAFMKLSAGGGTLAVADYFNMSNTASESGGDVDLGSGGVLLLPPLNDAQGQPRALAVGAGKDQHIYVVDRSNMGKFNPNTNAIYQDLPSSLSGPVFASPAWFNGKLYYGAVGDHLKAFSFTNGAFAISPVSQSPNTFGYPGTTPSISANGTSNGIVWAAENGSTAVLHAYDASDVSKELYNSNQAANIRDHFGAGNKFIVPAIVNGKVYVGTTNGVGVFGLLPPDFTLSASPSSGVVTSGGSTSYNVTVIPAGGFTGQVTLSVSGLPSGASGSFAPNPATASSTLSVTTSTSTPPGTYTLTISGVSGALTHTTTVSLTAVRATVTYDNSVSSGFQWNVTTVTTPSFVIGSGANRAAMIMVTMSANNATNITASLGGVSGAVIPGTDSGKTATIRTLIFQVINPPSGSQKATVSWTNTMNGDVGVITVSGADQTTPCTNGVFAAYNSSPAAGTSVTIASSSGDLTASLGYTTNTWVSPFTNQMLKWGIDSKVTGGDIGTGTGTTTHTWTDQFAGQGHAVSGANFKVSAAQPPDFTLSASPATQAVTQGGSTSYGVTINPAGGFTGEVSLSVSGLPTGANGSFSPNPATASSTLSLTTSANTPVGAYTLTITGISGTLTHSATVALVVNAPAPPDFTLSASPASRTITQGGSTSYDITIGPTGGFTGQVSLSLSGLPSGANGIFSPNPATASSTLSVTTSASTPTGTYTLTISGVSGALTHTATVSLAVTAPADFTLSATPASRTVTQGGSTSYSVTIGPTGGFTGQVSLSLSGLPSGANGIFSPNPATASSTLSVTTSASTPAGTYTLTISGVSGALTHTATVSLAVTAPPDFTLSASPGSQAVIQGGSTSYGVTINPTGGFTGQVTLSVSGLPSKANGSFSPNPATASSTLSVTTSASTPAGTYTLTISGVSGALTHTTTVSLAVTVPPDFTLSVSPVSQAVTQGGSANYGVTINPTGGFSGQVSLSVSGLPSGAGGSFSPNPATVSSTLSVTTSTSTPTGTYTLTIGGVSGILTHTTTVSLTVTAPPDFTVSASPTSRTLTQGGSTSYGVTISATGGFTGQVSLSVSGLPSGAGGSFSPNPATASSTLSLTTSASTPAGAYTLTIAGVSGTLTHTTTVSVKIR